MKMVLPFLLKKPQLSSIFGQLRDCVQIGGWSFFVSNKSCGQKQRGKIDKQWQNDEVIFDNWLLLTNKNFHLWLA